MGIRLQSPEYFFDNKNKHDMWIHPATKVGYQLDHFLVPCNQLRNVISIKHKFDGAPNDHCTLFLTYHLGNEKTFPTKLKNKVLKKIMKIDNDCLRTSGNSTLKKTLLNS